MQVLSLKIDKTRCVKGKKKWLFTYFLTCFFARTKWKIKSDCKIKDNNLRFWVDGSLALQVDELMYSGVVVFYEFISQWVGLSCSSYMIGGFILVLRHKDNKLLVFYRNIKSQNDLILKRRQRQGNHSAMKRINHYWLSTSYTDRHMQNLVK